MEGITHGESQPPSKRSSYASTNSLMHFDDVAFRVMKE